MKKLIYCILFIGTLFTTGCEDFTDLQPKGKNLLESTSDLELLLNNKYYYSSTDLREMAADMIYTFENVPTMLSNPNKSRKSIIISYDKTNMELMANLTNSDLDYNNWSEVIGKIANPILMQLKTIEGNESVKNQLKCEALVLRAYHHWLLVNKFAKAYNPATAANDPGIPYATEDWDITTPAKKLTVQQVYENILKDVNEALQLDCLPDESINQMRISKPCAYAVKALALMCMQDFDEAAKAAQSAIEINGNIMDYNTSTKECTSMFFGSKYNAIFREGLKCPEDYFYVYYFESFNAMTTECWNYFEPGHACKDKISTDKLMYDGIMSLGSMYSGLDYVYIMDMDSGWNQAGIKSTYMYLILAECAIHNKKTDQAMEWLDKIRINRIDPSVYAPLKGNVTDRTDAIEYLKKTSHGEGVYSIYNFLQKKRWNELDEFKQNWGREIQGVLYQIEPGSPMWVFPFPMNAVNLNPNLLPQNYEALV